MRECRSARGRPETAERKTKESPLLQRLYQFIDVVIERLEIVVEAGLAADRRVEHDHLRASFLRNRLRRLAVEIRLHDDGLDAVALDQVDQVERVRGRWRMPGFGSTVSTTS